MKSRKLQADMKKTKRKKLNSCSYFVFIYMCSIRKEKKRVRERYSFVFGYVIIVLGGNKLLEEQWRSSAFVFFFLWPVVRVCGWVLVLNPFISRQRWSFCVW